MGTRIAFWREELTRRAPSFIERRTTSSMFTSFAADDFWLSFGVGLFCPTTQTLFAKNRCISHLGVLSKVALRL